MVIGKWKRNDNPENNNVNGFIFFMFCIAEFISKILSNFKMIACYKSKFNDGVVSCI